MVRSSKVVRRSEVVGARGSAEATLLVVCRREVAAVCLWGAGSTTLLLTAPRRSLQRCQRLQCQQVDFWQKSSFVGFFLCEQRIF